MYVPFTYLGDTEFEQLDTRLSAVRWNNLKFAHWLIKNSNLCLMYGAWITHFFCEVKKMELIGPPPLIMLNCLEVICFLFCSHCVYNILLAVIKPCKDLVSRLSGLFTFPNFFLDTPLAGIIPLCHQPLLCKVLNTLVVWSHIHQRLKQLL